MFVVVTIAVVLAVAVTVLVARWPSSTDSSTYGGLPSWLPTSTVAVGRVVTASAAHPALAIEGDSVVADLAHGHVLVTAVGPAVPAEGQFPMPRTSPCTFTITLADASGAVPVSAAAFSIVDELGQVHRPQVTAQGGQPPPTSVRPGRPLVLTLTDVLPVGSGTLRWAPQGAKVVSWDFEVEID
ncbi:MAG TPA: hypothetical protein VEI83_05405 [Acidimicrobiales bacterium]|nr:hypothetical protein [Acidimicrobiales bacterium]